MEKTKLGNIVAKEFLESKGVQVFRFQKFRKEKPAKRPTIIQMQGGETSVPVPTINKEMRETSLGSTVQKQDINQFKRSLLSQSGSTNLNILNAR